MSFYKSYASLMKQRGSTKAERNLKYKQRSFDRYFDESLNRYDVILNGQEVPMIIQDVNQNNNKDLSDDKYIISKNDVPLNVGSLIYWDNVFWIIFTTEHKTIKTHNQAKIKMSNYVIKWAVGDQTVCNNGEGYQAFVQNQTLYTLGVSKSSDYVWIANAKMMMYMPHTEETEAIEIGQRIFIGKNVYQVMFKDIVSRKGLINYLLEEDFVNPNTDNTVLGVADYFHNPNDNPYVESTEPNYDETYSQDNEIPETEDDSEVEGDIDGGSEEAPLVNKTLTLIGNDTVKIKKQIVIASKVTDENGNEYSDDVIVNWSVSDLDGAVTVVAQDTQSITLQATTSYDLIGSVVVVYAKSKSGLTATKKIEIVGAY